MKKKFFYIAMVALALTGCSDSLSTIGSSDGNSEITIPADAEAGELLIKFSPEMSDILDQAQLSKTRSGKATRSFYRRGARHPGKLQLRACVPSRCKY